MPTSLLIIDPQNDFHLLGSLAIPSANKDALNISTLLTQHGKDIDFVSVTLDSHNVNHIANAGYWLQKQADGSYIHPNPFTIITSESLASGEFKTTCESDMEWGKRYCSELEGGGKFELCVWPDHCLIGSHGHAVQSDVFKGLDSWCRIKSVGGNRKVNWVMKGSDDRTEMYSGLKSEVQVDADKDDFNYGFLKQIILGVHEPPEGEGEGGRQIIVVGQASSHCVNFTVRDIMSHFPENKVHSNLIVVKDCMSAVPGFEGAEQNFFEDVIAWGGTVCGFEDIVW